MDSRRIPGRGSMNEELDKELDEFVEGLEGCYHGAVRADEKDLPKHPRLETKPISTEEVASDLKKKVEQSSSWAREILNRNSERAVKVISDAQARSSASLDASQSQSYKDSHTEHADSPKLIREKKEKQERLDKKGLESSRELEKKKQDKQVEHRERREHIEIDFKSQQAKAIDAEYRRVENNPWEGDPTTFPIGKLISIIISIVIIAGIAAFIVVELPTLIGEVFNSLEAHAIPEEQQILTPSIDNFTPDNNETKAPIAIAGPELDSNEESGIQVSEDTETKKPIGVTPPDTPVEDEPNSKITIAIPDQWETDEYEQSTILFTVINKERDTFTTTFYLENNAFQPSTTEVQSDRMSYYDYEIGDQIPINCWVNENNEIKFSPD